MSLLKKHSVKLFWQFQTDSGVEMMDLAVIIEITHNLALKNKSCPNRIYSHIAGLQYNLTLEKHNSVALSSKRINWRWTRKNKLNNLCASLRNGKTTVVSQRLNMKTMLPSFRRLPLRLLSSSLWDLGLMGQWEQWAPWSHTTWTDH